MKKNNDDDFDDDFSGEYFWRLQKDDQISINCVSELPLANTCVYLKDFPFATKINRLLFWIIIFKLFDVITTIYGNSIGLTELNPMGVMLVIIGSCIIIAIFLWVKEFQFTKYKFVKSFNKKYLYIIFSGLLFINIGVVGSNIILILLKIFYGGLIVV